MIDTTGWTRENPTENGWYFYSSDKNPCLALRYERERFWVQIPSGYDHPIIFKPKDGLFLRIPNPPPIPKDTL